MSDTTSQLVNACEIILRGWVELIEAQLQTDEPLTPPEWKAFQVDIAHVDSMVDSIRGRSS